MFYDFCLVPFCYALTLLLALNRRRTQWMLIMYVYCFSTCSMFTLSGLREMLHHSQSEVHLQVNTLFLYYLAVVLYLNTLCG